jgi:hypothetical protein
MAAGLHPNADEYPIDDWVLNSVSVVPRGSAGRTNPMSGLPPLERLGAPKPNREGATHASHGMAREGQPRIDGERAAPAQKETLT